MAHLKQPLTVFIVLQVLDFATTLVALALGGGETNPLVRSLLVLGPVSGLVLAKAVALAVGLLAYFMGKRRGIRNANRVYSAIVIWNFTIIARLSLATAV
jgi:hypothetical protein